MSKPYTSLTEEMKMLRGQTEKSAVFTFGRFQPPTTGHMKLVEAVKSTAAKRDADPFVFPSRSKDDKKNPLTPDDKIYYMRKAFGRGVRIINDRKATTIFKAMESLVSMGYTNLTLVVGSDRVAEFTKTITPYVDDMGLTSFEVVSAGERDPAASGVKGMSASKLRAAAAANDFDAFRQGVPGTLRMADVETLFAKLRKSIRLTEETLTEAKRSRNVLVISKSPDSDTSSKLLKAAKELGQTPVFIQSESAYIEKIKGSKITIENYDDKGSKIVVDAEKDLAFVRGSAVMTSGGRSLVEGLGKCSMLMINPLEVFELANNKYTINSLFERRGIPHPKTVLVTSDKMLEKAHKKVGGKFPVIIKSLQGAEGIGVVKVDSQDSLRSVVQSLKSHGAEILMQEMLKIDGDIRTIVLDNKIVASMKRIKPKKDFRSNKALGAETVPYKLSQKEKEFVREIARISGAALLGVDHVVDKNGNIYAIEINASPGSGSPKYTNYISYENKGVFSDEVEGTVNGYELIKEIVSRSLDMKKPTPPMTLGRVEMVTVAGRTVKARIDTGNSTYSALDARDIKKEGNNKISFTFDGERYTKEIVDSLKIHIGDSNVQLRHVVEMPMTIGNRNFISRFSLSNRERNVYPVLIGNEFMKKENVLVNPSAAFVAKMVGEATELNKKEKSVKNTLTKSRQATEDGIDFSSPPEEGTDEIVRRYKKMTPGELNELFDDYFKGLGD